jgi:hypothetical protein
MAKKQKSCTPMCGPSAAEERKWKAEDALRTLRRAEEIRNDPALMRAAQRMAKDEQAALARIADTKGSKRR